MFRSTSAGCIFFGTFQVRKAGPIKQPKRNMGVIQMEKTMIDYHGILWNSLSDKQIYIYMYWWSWQNQEPETTHNHHDPTTA